MATAPGIHAVGSKVWLKHHEEWCKGEVIKEEGDSLLIRAELANGQPVDIKATINDCPLQNPDTNGMEDMTKLPYLHEPGVLYNLETRYKLDEIYTYTGTILIAVNPFQALPHLYGTYMMDQYRGLELGDLSPHVYAIADAAYKQMTKAWKGQSILVSGESGAGKTETSKLIMKYLAYMGGYKGGSEGQGGPSVEEQVLESNPLLEAFGNAKTVRNDNSSRFGKYVEINFNKQGVISGAAIRTYLLERSRVVAVNNPERNYHIFYQICDGASKEQAARWYLQAATQFRYLNQSTCYELPGVNNAEEFQRTIRAMERVGIPEAQQEAIFRTVAAILHMGNIQFEQGPNDSTVAKPITVPHLAATAALLGVDQAALLQALATRTRQTVEGPIRSPLDVKAAGENRDSLSKIIYAKMFDWLVTRVNMAIGEDTNCAASVGVLDIYGFESFKQNDFEQFCINLANEKLQQHFNHHVFKQEQAEYEREKIDWSYIEFVDNQDVLDLIENKMGIIELLDEQCRFPTATGKDLAQKLYTAASCTNSKRFSKPKTSQSAFTIDHYAGGVTYECTNFLEKNKDFVVAEHQVLLGNSTHEFIRELFKGEEVPETETPAAKGPAAKGGLRAFKFNSVGAQFKKQLAELMTQLQMMEPHYIRCIKPNNANRPTLFDGPNVLHQLRCGGVLEAVRISCAGFPAKRPYAEFVDHYWPIAPALLHSEEDDRVIAEGILRKTSTEGYQLGETKVFLRAGQMAVLDKLRADTMAAAATCIQRHMKGHLTRKAFRTRRDAVLCFQSWVRGMQARRQAHGRREVVAAQVIQTLWRGTSARLDYTRAVTAIKRLQAAYRGRIARRRFGELQRQQAALTLQAGWRGFVARRVYTTQQQAATTMQNAWRAQLAKRAIRKFKTDAREAGKLLEDKKALEEKVKQLQENLENVQRQRNELRQVLREQKAVKEDSAARLAELQAQKEAMLAEAKAQAQEEVLKEKEISSGLREELAKLQASMKAAQEEHAKMRADQENKLRVAQDYIGRLTHEKGDLDKRFHGMKDELIARLQNACAQRDEARGQVLELQNALGRLEQDLAARDKQLVAMQAALAGQGPAPLAPSAVAASGALPSALANGAVAATPEARRMGTPGYAKSMYESASTFMAGGTPGTMSPGMGPRVARLTNDGDGTATPETDLERRTRELQAKQQQLIQEKRKADEERLLAAISSPMGFHKGKPLAALVIFRSCLHWRAFQADRTSIFDRIIQVIGGQIEKQQDENKCLAYWLTNTVTLLHLLQKNIKPASGSQFKGGRTATQAMQGARNMLGGLFGRPTPLGGEASIHGGGVGGFRQVEAKYPALLFKQQLDAFVQKIFPMMRDNVKKQITPMLANCIHTPRGVARGGQLTRRGSNQDPSSTTPQLSRYWSDILGVFDVLLATVKEAHVPRVLVQALFRQLFSFVNVQLFNQLLLRRECCSFSNGEYVKTGLAQVENWISEAGQDYVGESWDELKYIRQAVTFLVIGNKPKKSLDEITHDLCPVLSIQQLYRISTMYWDDKYNTETVSGEVLARMKQLMVDNNSTSSHSFLLDDDSTLPFAAQEVLSAMDDKDLYSGLPVPEQLRDAGAAAAAGDAAGGSTPGAGGSSAGGGFAFLEKELRFSSGPAS